MADDGLTTTTGEIDSEVEAIREGTHPAALWIKKVERAKQDEKDWRDKAQAAVAIYECDEGNAKTDGAPEFNILHSNVETTVPALYNSTPIPDVRRRFGDADPVAKLACDMMERGLSYSVDQYDFDDTIIEAAKDGEIAGRGQVRIRYEPEIEGDRVGYQKVACELVPWDRWGHGPARLWEQVPFIYFEHDYTRKELRDLGVSKKRIEHLTLTGGETASKATGDSEMQTSADPKGVLKSLPVYEIWDKETAAVLFVTPNDKSDFLAIKPDPLKLERFFPVPKPLQPLRKRSDLTPICPYEVYKAQVAELESVSRRIRALVKQLKVRGMTDAAIQGDLERVSELDDGQYIAVDDASRFVAGAGGLEAHIVHWPIETIIIVLKELYVQREQIKQIIYEVTGLSDVLRGATDPNETLGAQQLKMQTGSQRLSQRQKRLAEFCCSILKIKAEIICEHYTPENLMQMTGMQIPPEAMPQVMALIKNDLMRSFRIDIETDSTIRADVARSQEQMTRFLEGTAAYGQAMAPVLQAFPGAKPAVVEIYTSFARNFKLGKSAEDALDQLSQMAQQPEEPKPSPEEMKMQLDQQSMQMQQQADQQKMAMEQQAAQQQATMEGQKMQAEMQRDERKAQMELQKMQMEIEFKREELALKRETMQMDIAHKQQMADLDMQATQAKIGAEREAMDIKRQGQEQDLVAKDEMHAINARGAEAKAKAAGKPNGAPA